MLQSAAEQHLTAPLYGMMLLIGTI